MAGRLVRDRIRISYVFLDRRGKSLDIIESVLHNLLEAVFYSILRYWLGGKGGPEKAVVQWAVGDWQRG